MFLGPGLAPGLASLGVLYELEARGIPIARVAGANTGALAGALWAVEADLAFAARVLSRLPWSSYAVGRDLGASDPLLSALHLLTRGKRFEDLERELAVFVWDADGGERRRVTSGSIAAALRGSLAVPGLFHPLRLEARWADGGVAWAGALPADAGDRRTLSIATAWDGRGGEGASASGFSSYQEELAVHAALAWGGSGTGGATLWIGSRALPQGLLGFSDIEAWFDIGRRALRSWLAEEPRGRALEE